MELARKNAGLSRPEEGSGMEELRRMLSLLRTPQFKEHVGRVQIGSIEISVRFMDFVSNKLMVDIAKPVVGNILKPVATGEIEFQRGYGTDETINGHTIPRRDGPINAYVSFLIDPTIRLINEDLAECSEMITTQVEPPIMQVMADLLHEPVTHVVSSVVSSQTTSITLRGMGYAEGNGGDLLKTYVPKG